MAGETLKVKLKQLQDGIDLQTGETVTIDVVSTGYLSVRLLDASGTVPLKGRKAKVEVPGEGAAELTTDDAGKIFKPDVPLQEYELELDGGVKIVVPAVEKEGEVQDRNVPGVRLGFVNLVVYTGDTPLASADIAVDGAGSRLSLKTDGQGKVRHGEPVPAGEYQVSSGEAYAKVLLPERPDQPAIVRISMGDDDWSPPDDNEAAE